jgi:predicted phosphodiesterase
MVDINQKMVNKMSNELSFFGDTHGKFDQLIAECQEHSTSDRVYQVGDLGIGFKPVPSLPQNFKFIRGNHDDPELARAHDHFLGDYGVDEYGVGFISGAYSIDYSRRVEGVDWWRDEELGYYHLQEGIEQIVEAQPEIIITHTAPKVLRSNLIRHHYPNRTDSALDELATRINPRYWVCGHFHKSFEVESNGTLFKCLNELETLTIGGY